MSSQPPRMMKLFTMLWNSGGHLAGWRHPDAAPEGLHAFAYFNNLAQLAERAKFDSVFFADSQGWSPMKGRNALASTDLVKLEPLTLISALAVTTKHVGLVATVATSFSSPYRLARQFASIDHLSHGRVGWNIVTGTSENEAHNVGLDHNISHDERYARGAEFVEIVMRLWDSFEDGAMVRDKKSGLYFDPDKLHGLGHEGKYYKVAGPLNIARPPQGHPVMVQAGSSDVGRAFAARFAEAIFTSHSGLDTAKPFYDDIKRQVAAAGRNPDHVKILPSVSPIVGSTEAEALRIAKDLDDLIPTDLAVSLLERSLGGIDLSGFPVNGPLPPIPPTENAQSTQARIVHRAKTEGWSIEQAARYLAANRTSKSAVGAPEQIADQLELWFKTPAADGFVLTPPYFPGQFEVLTATLIPILQERGLFRKDYEGTTLRENLGLPRPPNYYAGHPERHVEPEIWL